MKYLACSAILAGALLLAGGQAKSADDSLPNPYQAPIEHWGQLPEGREWGGVSDEAFDSKGHLWVIERCGGRNCAGSDLAPILEFDTETAKVLKSFGGGMFVQPHGIYIDHNDNDNVWVVDQSAEDAKGEQVWKFTPDGKLLMTLGKAGVKGEGPDTFNDPTGVVIGRDGDIFILDGHVGKNQTVARIVKFSKDGKFLKTWGKKDNQPGDLNDPHNLALDRQGRLFVADRGNSRIDIFDQDGNLLDTWKQFGDPSAVFIDDKDTLYVAQNFLHADAPEFKRGIRIGSAKTGKITGFIEDPDQDPKQTTLGPESLKADKNGTIYAGEVDRKEIKKYVLK